MNRTFRIRTVIAALTAALIATSAAPAAAGELAADSDAAVVVSAVDEPVDDSPAYAPPAARTRTALELRTEDRLQVHVATGYDTAGQTPPDVYSDLTNYSRWWADQLADGVCPDDSRTCTFEHFFDAICCAYRLAGVNRYVSSSNTYTTLTPGQIDQYADWLASHYQAHDEMTDVGVGVTYRRRTAGSMYVHEFTAVVVFREQSIYTTPDAAVTPLPAPGVPAPADTTPIIDPGVTPVPPTKQPVPQGCQDRFVDLDPRSPVGQAASCLSDVGIVAGYDDGAYRPARPVTRAQMASFIARAVDAYADQPLAAGRPGFTDALPAVHAPAVGKLTAAGIATGYTDGSFRPAVTVTRGQMATFLARAAEHTTGRPLPHPGRQTFPDVAGSTHADAIARVAAAGIALGGTDGRYRPNAPVTRGQMAMFLDRWVDTVNP